MAGCMNFGFMGEARESNYRSVAVIGAGPSGLAAAGYLASLGYSLDVYDKLPRAGGLLLFGIPGRRLPSERVRCGVRQLEERYDVRFHLRTKICGNEPLHNHAGDQFTERVVSLGGRMMDHDAVLVCTGAWRSRKLDVPGQDLPGVHSALEFLFPLRAAEYDPDRVVLPEVKGRRVVVIGAGHSAVDAVRAAMDMGALSVTVLYRRTMDQAPCGRLALEQLRTSGAEIKESMLPVRILGRDEVTGVEAWSCRKAEPDASGRPGFLPVSESRLFLRAEVVIAALGEIPTPPFARELGLDGREVNPAHWLQMTALEGVFVAGDVLIRPSKIGRAIYSGLRAAKSLHEWLELTSLNRRDEYDYDADTIDPCRFQGSFACPR